jgi:hypothetical protein
MTHVGIVGQPQVMAALDRLDDRSRQNLERRAVRAGAKVIQRQMRFEGDTPGHPHSFTKVVVRVSSSMRRGGVPTAFVRPRSPLFNILEPGARAHTITPGEKGLNSYRPSRPSPTRARQTGRRALAGRKGGSVWPENHSEAGRKRPDDFFSTGPVNHPGLAARPILPATIAAAGQAARDTMAEVVFGWMGEAL